MTAEFMAKVVETPVSVDEAMSYVRREDCGAALLFLGTVRNHNHGRRVLRLNYTAYREMAEKELAKIASVIIAEGKIERVAIIHRIGEMNPGEISVAIAVSSHHRSESFESCRRAIETLKKTVPIWKEEIFEDGREWVGRCQHDE